MCYSQKMLPLLILCLAGHALSVDVDVLTEYGLVRGHTVNVNLLDGSSKTVNSFLGIPFGKSPTGDLRFEVGIYYFLWIS